MQDRVFIDTNVFIYLYSTDEDIKKEKAIEAINEYDSYTSTQAINELSNVLIKKFNMKTEDIKNVVDEIYSNCEVITLDSTIIKSALDIHSKYKFSYYDSLMLATAVNSECSKILSEDMNDGQVIEKKLTITNIFK